MEDYLNKNIKEILNQFPEVADVLNEYNIGCVPCHVGSCLLKDIVEIHNLPLEEEQVLMARIALVIYPGQEIKIPRIIRKTEVTTRETSYSPPMKKLVDEHTLIKRMVALIPGVIDSLDLESEAGRQIIRDVIEFIRFYADKYHHAKEEEILFKFFDENLSIIETMHQDHETARAHVRAILAALDEKDKDGVTEHLKAYQELLSEHITKEDGILYPWMDRNLSITQVGELFARFNEKEQAFGTLPGKYEGLIENLEEKIIGNKLKEAVK